MYKLIRDKIPEVMEKSGKTCLCAKILEDDLFEEVLLSKLVEECNELVKAVNTKSNVIEEIVDVQTVLNTIKSTYHISDEDVDKLYQTKADEKGLFNKKILGFFEEDK